MRTNKKIAGIAVVGAFALSLGVALPANADYAPSGTDAVGVGGDTPQYDFSFLADGDINGNLGYNAAGNAKKLISFDSVADSNGRSAFASDSTPTTNVALNPTIVLRAGTAPIQRPQSTGIGYTLFNQDTTKQINYVRAGRLPTAAEQTTASNNGWGYLHSIKIATDQIQIAVASTTNAPSGLSVDQLVKIYNGTYTTWGQVPGYTGPAPSGVIVPLLPPTTSVIRTTLLATLKAANGGVTVPLAGTVRTVQQNDPSTITNLNATEEPNAFVSFSAARLNLWANGFFRDPNTSTVIPGSPLTAGVKLLTGTPGGVTATPYSDTIGHYVVFRQSDYASTTPWQPGSTKNWVQALFYDGASGSPFLKKTAGQTLIASSGATPEYTDQGSTSAG